MKLTLEEVIKDAADRCDRVIDFDNEAIRIKAIGYMNQAAVECVMWLALHKQLHDEDQPDLEGIE